MQKIKEKYLELTDGKFKEVIPLDVFSISNLEEVIMEYLFKNNTNKFNIELLMFPSWTSKNKIYKINDNYYTHIRIKKDF